MSLLSTRRFLFILVNGLPLTLKNRKTIETGGDTPVFTKSSIFQRTYAIKRANLDICFFWVVTVSAYD